MAGGSGRRVIKFVVLFVGYALLHVQRKSLGNVKSVLASRYGYSAALMGYLDLDFFICYGIAMYIAGTLIERSLSERMKFCSAGLSLLVTGVFTALMGISPAPWAILVLWGLATASQAATWPLCVSIVSLNFHHVTIERKGAQIHIIGVLFGVFALSLGVGNILGGVLGDQVLSSKSLDWSWVFYITAICVFLWGIVILAASLGLYPSKSASLELEEAALLSKSPKRLPFLQEVVFVLRLPGVLWYAASNTFVKLVMYALMFSLPLYIGNELGYGKGTSDLLANFFDIGTVVGSVIFGLLTDKIKAHFGGRSIVLMPLLVLSSAIYPLLIYYAKESKGVLIALLLAAGTLTGSSYNLIASAVSSDLGQGNGNIAGVASIVTAFGSIGAGIGSVVLGYIRQYYGWPGFLWAMCAASLLGAVSLSYVVKREISNRNSSAKLLSIQ